MVEAERMSVYVKGVGEVSVEIKSVLYLWVGIGTDGNCSYEKEKE